MIDLGAWASERYRLASDGQAADALPPDEASD
jgi:endogenous inhibitor of DNA gyrase (YacG/DUF329 family)